MSAALPRRQYRDPLEQLLEAEAQSCKGCTHLEHGRGVDWCMNPNIKAKLAERRCDEYEERE